MTAYRIEPSVVEAAEHLERVCVAGCSHDAVTLRGDYGYVLWSCPACRPGHAEGWVSHSGTPDDLVAA